MRALFTRSFVAILLLCFSLMNPAWAEKILPFKQIFHPQIEQEAFENGYKTTIRISIPEDFYLYSDKTYLTTNADKPMRFSHSQTITENDPYFGKVEIFTHDNPAIFTVTTKTPEDRFTLHAQGCRKNVICYPPSSWTLSVASQGPIDSTPNTPKASAAENLPLPTSIFISPQIESPNTSNVAPKSNNLTPSAVSNQSDIYDKLANSYWLSLPLLILLGLSVSLTACVYPLIPIITSLVIGKQQTTGKSYRLISVYVLAMAAAMAMLGAIFGIFQINLQIVLQKPWIATLVALFFVAMALSMFEVFTLKMPAIWQNKINHWSDKQSSGSYIGAAIMGALSILIVSPCATPVLTGLLLFATQTTPIKAALALFCFGLGTGIPLLIFASVLKKFMPKAGNWMRVIKKILAFLLLAIAIWIVVRIIPAQYSWLAASAYLLALAISLESNYKAIPKWAFLWRYFAGAAFIAAIVCAMQFGSFTQNQANLIKQELHTTVTSPQELQRLVERSNRPVIVDITADWCLSCRVMEKTIWQNPIFASDFRHFEIIRYDVTHFNEADQNLFSNLDLIGPPAILFYQPKSTLSYPRRRVIGEVSSQEFATILNSEIEIE